MENKLRSVGYQRAALCIALLTSNKPRVSEVYNTDDGKFMQH